MKSQSAITKTREVLKCKNGYNCLALYLGSNVGGSLITMAYYDSLERFQICHIEVKSIERKTAKRPVGFASDKKDASCKLGSKCV